MGTGMGMGMGMATATETKLPSQTALVMISSAFFLYSKPRNLTTFSCRVGLLTVILSGFFLSAGAEPTSGLGLASSFSIVPRVSTLETYTNNVFLNNADRRTDLISQISPGIHISSRGGRISGSLDYSLSEFLYANGSSGRHSENSLNAIGTVEMVDNWAFLDFNGVIGRQTISAFGAPSNDPTALNGNSTETSVFRLSPFVRGRIGSVADYVARYSLTSNQSKSTLVSNVEEKKLSAKLTGVGGRIGSGWTLLAEQESSDYSGGRSTQSQRVNGQYDLPFDATLGVYVKVTHESNDLASATDQQGNFTALGVNWTPNEETRVSIDRDSRGATGLIVNWAPSKRTSVSVTRERRLYGDTQNIALAYRTASTAWTFSDTRSAVSSQNLSSAAVSLYDLLTAQFAAGESDPLKRQQYDVFLQANGIKPNATAVLGFLTSAVSLQRQQQLSFALFGARSTVSVIATRSSNSRLDRTSTAVDDLSNSPVVQENGLTVNFSQRLSARAVLSLIAATQRSSGSLGQAGTSSRSVNLNLSTQLNKDTSATVGARRVVFDSSTAPYTETAVTGSLSVQF